MAHDKFQASIPQPINFSAVLICKDGAQYLPALLEILSICDEVLYADTGSTDESVEIAKTFSNVKIIRLAFEGFGRTKANAVKAASNNWILSIDADEQPDLQLLGATQQLIQSAPVETLGRVTRINLFAGKPLRFSRWGRDHLIRVFNKEHTNFTDDLVHEKITIKDNSTSVNLNGTIKHFAIHSQKDFVTKNERYNSLRSDSRLPKIAAYSLAGIKGFARFIKIYIIGLSILDGSRGLTIALESSRGVLKRHSNRANR